MPRDPDQYDFFVSYARADNQDGWISGFVEELCAAHRRFSGGREFVPFFDTQDNRSLDDWQQRLYHALAASRLFLAFLSPNYFAGEWCRHEWRTWVDLEIAKHVLSAGAAPLYIVEVPGLLSDLDEQEVARRVAELCTLPVPHIAFLENVSPLIHQLRRRQINAVEPFYSKGLDALREDDLQRVLDRLAHDLDERAEEVRRAAESETTVPPYNKQFSGRLDELLDLRDRLKDDWAGVISGVHGLGGVGKTELAFTYAHAFAGAYPGGRFLIECEGKPTLRDALLGTDSFTQQSFIRDRINEAERMTPDLYFAAITRCLRERLDERGHILLVLDNVTNAKLLERKATNELTALGPMMHLLATTRLPAAEGSHISWTALGELNEAESLELLEKHRRFADDSEREAARHIVQRLRGFALAVELVGAWLAAHPSATCAGLTKSLGLDDLDLMAEDQDVELRRHNDERRLQAVVGPTLEGLSAAERLAVEYAACLAPDHVPLPWLRELVVDAHPAFGEPGPLRVDPWQELCGRLSRLAIFSRADGEGHQPRLVRIHRLIQDLLKDSERGGLSESDLAMRLQTVEAVAAQRANALKTTTNWQEARWEIEPLDALAHLWADTEHPQATWLLNHVGLLWDGLAEWPRAEPLMRRALAIDEQSYGTEYPEVAIRLNNLAQLLQATNRLAEAEPLMRRALAIDERSYGEGHPNVATALNNLAQLLQTTNRLTEAEPLMRRALAIDEQSYGAEHPEVAIRLNNLAALLKETNRLAEAEPLMRRALAIDERSYGEGHPNVATALNNLAQLLQTTNRLAEAEPLMRRALAIDEQSYGAEHPTVAIDLNNLAALLMETNRLAEAETLMARVATIFEQSYGEGHPNVAIALNNLALLLRATNRLTEAEPLMRRALAIDEQSYGAEHPKVAIRLTNLAALLKETNRLTEAEPLLRRALAIDEQSYGAEHPEVAIHLNNLAALLKETNRLAEAEPLMARVVTIFERSYGEWHPNVATALNNLAQLLQTTNRLAEAEPLMRRHLEIFLKFAVATGQRHLHLQAAFGNYAGLLQAMGRSEAEVREEVTELLAKYGMSVD